MADQEHSENPGAGTPPPGAEAELEGLRAAAARAQEYLELAKRTQAEFVNWQARARRDQDELRKYAVENFARELLPVLDALAHTAHLEAGSPEAKAIVEGAGLVEREMLRVLGKFGIQPVESAGKPFDPRFHEAVERVETDEAPDGVILAEGRRGYTIHDRVLRPAQVRVARRPAKPVPGAGGGESEAVEG